MNSAQIQRTAMSMSPQQNKECEGRELRNKNLIDELPDDILVYILSFLTLKEAGKTSVLSTKWRHVWAYITTLDFDSRKFFDGAELATSVEGDRYLNWIDSVVSTHKAPTIKTFRVLFDISLLGNSSNSIDNWFRFAMEKGVKKLAIDLSLHARTDSARHTFPVLPICNTLTSLKLGCVNVTDEILENIISNCRALEYLLVKHSDSLVRLKVCGPSLILKDLIIRSCTRLEQLEISAPNLVHISYSGPKINVQFKNVPKLVDVSFGHSSADDMIHICSDLSSCLSQIEVFRLESAQFLMKRKISVGGSVFTRIKMLTVLARPKWNDDLYCFIPLLKACPLLQNFELALLMNAPDYNKHRDLRQWENFTYNNLKIVTIMGFVGHAVALEFACYLLASANSLDQIIINTQVLVRLSPGEVEELRKQAREHAELLRTFRNCGAKLQIL